METIYKNEIINIVELLTKSLESINRLSIDNVKDEKLIASFENIRGVIFKGISNIKYNIEILTKVAEWDKLNVSFFGETNAGKSTIIEALINGDGRSIGEGYKDFTKSMSIISHDNINLMDMPGIEGREHKVINNIREAVNKSHIVFYVIGTNKEPEEQTIFKIKNFLKDNARIYSIINVRAKPTVYKYKTELKDKNTITVENRVINKFTALLNKNYAGNVVVNGYLALLKSNRLNNSRFEPDQKKAIEIFGSIKDFEKFSNINEINSIIAQLSHNINDEITISNTYKFLKSLELILSRILREKKEFDSFIKQTSILSIKYFDDIDRIISKYEPEINLCLDVNINKMSVALKKAISHSIDNDQSESLVKLNLNKVKEEQSVNLNESIKELLAAMKDEIDDKIKEFKDRISLQVQFLNLKGDFNLGNILETLEINFKYILSQIVDVAMSIWGVVVAFGVNPILGVIAAVFALVKKLWSWIWDDPDQRKRETKSKAFKKIDLMTNNIEDKVRQDLERELQTVKLNVKKPVIQLRESMKGIKSISISIDDKIAEIMRSQLNLSLLLIKKFLGEKVIFAYLDLHLSEAIIIGYIVNDKVKGYLINLFRIKNINFYTTYHEWLSEAGSAEQGTDIFIAKDEFNFRAINLLILHDSHVLKYKKTKRS